MTYRRVDDRDYAGLELRNDGRVAHGHAVLAALAREEDLIDDLPLVDGCVRGAQVERHGGRGRGSSGLREAPRHPLRALTRGGDSRGIGN